MVESIYFLKPAWCGTHFAGLWPEQGLQPVTRATALRRWFVTREWSYHAICEWLSDPVRWLKYLAPLILLSYDWSSPVCGPADSAICVMNGSRTRLAGPPLLLGLACLYQ